MKKHWKHIIEGILIVFSVLFALFINKAYDNYQLEQKKQVALVSIEKELQKNLEITTQWKKNHIKIYRTLSDMIEGRNDSLVLELRKYSFLNMGIITNNENMIDAFLSNTTWESVKTTGIVAEFDFQTVELLTDVYTLQEMMTQKTLMRVFDFYFDKEAHNMKDLDATLMQFQLRFSELVGQEQLLEGFYKKTLAKLNTGYMEAQ